MKIQLLSVITPWQLNEKTKYPVDYRNSDIRPKTNSAIVQISLKIHVTAFSVKYNWNYFF